MKPLSSALAAVGLAAALAWAASLGVIAVAAPAAPPAAAAAPRGAAAADTTGAEERADGIVAVVGGEPVFQSEVDEQLYLFLMQSGTRPDSATAAGLRKRSSTRSSTRSSSCRRPSASR
jgi:hypothetical protein